MMDFTQEGNFYYVTTFFFKSPCEKKSVFFADFALQNIVETTLPDRLKTSGWRVYR